MLVTPALEMFTPILVFFLCFFVIRMAAQKAPANNSPVSQQLNWLNNA